MPGRCCTLLEVEGYGGWTFEPLPCRRSTAIFESRPLGSFVEFGAVAESDLVYIQGSHFINGIGKIPSASTGPSGDMTGLTLSRS